MYNTIFLVLINQFWPAWGASYDIFRGSFSRKEEFRERIGKILFVLVGCKRFERRMTQTTQHFHEVSDSFQERIDVWGWMMWPLWPEGGGSGGQSPEWPEPEGHKGHIMKTQTSILEWKLSLTEWKRWVVWGILTSKILQPKRTIRILPILSPNSETAKDPRMLFSSLLKGSLCFVKMFA